MAKTGQDTETMDLRDFFSASEARIDRWHGANADDPAVGAWRGRMRSSNRLRTRGDGELV